MASGSADLWTLVPGWAICAPSFKVRALRLWCASQSLENDQRNNERQSPLKSEGHARHRWAPLGPDELIHCKSIVAHLDWNVSREAGTTVLSEAMLLR